MNDEKALTAVEKLQVLEILEKTGSVDPNEKQRVVMEIEEKELQRRMLDAPIRERSAFGFASLDRSKVAAMAQAKEPGPMLDETDMMLGKMAANGGLAYYAQNYQAMKRNERPEFNIDTEELEAPLDPSLTYPDVSLIE